MDLALNRAASLWRLSSGDHTCRQPVSTEWRIGPNQMRIGRHTRGSLGQDDLGAELDEILKFDHGGGPVCGPACQRAGARDCSRHCPDIPRALSSDPENFPLEAGIAPLVYEFKRLGVFEPCWSCEGHNRADGSLWKLPQVWFYCRSVVHLRVLADGIKELHVEGKLSVPWHISITYSDGDNTDTTFSLHPYAEHADARLALLQKDVDTIAAHLRDSVFAKALELSRKVR